MLTIRGRTAQPSMPLRAPLCLVTCAAALLCANAWAQPASTAEPIPLEALEALTPAALIAALEASNPNLQSVAAAAEAAALRVAPAGALADPMFTYAIAPNSIGSEINVRHTGQFSQPLPWPGKRDLRQAVASHRAEAAAQKFEVTRLELVAKAQHSFAEWHFLYRAIEINTATAELLTELTRVAETRYAAGRALQQDVLQAELETVLLQERLLMLEHERIGLRARINALLNRAAAAPLPPPADIATPIALPGIEALRQNAAIGHPEIRQIEAQVAATSSQRDLADKAFRPDFSANVGYIGTLDPDEKRLQIGLSINIPIYREKRRAELDAANADLRRDQYALTAQRVEILAALESAYAHTHHAIEVVQLYETRLLELAAQNLEAAFSDYRSGAGQFSNVVEAERRLLETRQGYERARADYWRMRAELDLAAGGTLETAAATASLISTGSQRAQ